MSSFTRKNQRGDTIVEVLISIAILALALAISYSLANRSLRTGLSASARTEATAVAQGQIELLKGARYNNPASFDSQFRGTGAFCVNAANLNRQTAPSSACTANGYSTSITYDSSSKVHTVTTNWDTFNPEGEDDGRDQLVIYYRVPQ